MKKRNLLKIFISVFTLFAFFGVIGNVYAAYDYPKAKSAQLIDLEPYPYSSTGISYGTHTTSKFYLRIYDGYAQGTGPNAVMNGNVLADPAVGICMHPTAASPEKYETWSANRTTGTQDPQPELRVLDNTPAIKVLYYGLCPDGCDHDYANDFYQSRHHTNIDDNTRVVLVHTALSKINGTNYTYGLNGVGTTDTDAFIEYVNRLDYPLGAFGYVVGNDLHQTLAVIYTTKYGLQLNKKTEPENSSLNLKGAVYKIYSDKKCEVPAVKNRFGEVYEDLVTNERGNTNTVNVVTKHVYYVKETRRPSIPGTNQENMKFSLDPTCYKCDLYENGTCPIESKDDYVEEASLRIRKVDENGNILGNANVYTVFNVYRGGYVQGTEQCDTSELVQSLTLNNSKATRTIDSIPLGEYCIHEQQGIPGYDTLPDKVINVTESALYEYVAVNEKQVKGSVRVKKVDQDHEPLAGATFTIHTGGLNADETACEGDVIATITSQSNGYATKTGLEPGNYCLMEASAPLGYTKAEGAQTFVITDEANAPTVELEEMVNEAGRGWIRISKIIDPTVGIKVDLQKNDNYTFVGTTFSVYKGECYSSNLVAQRQISSDLQPYVVVDDLELGETYCIAETSAPKGYDKSSSEKTIKLTYSNPYDYATFEDKPRLGSLRLIKYSNNKSLLESNPKKYSLEGAQYRVTDKDGNEKGILAVGPEENGKYYTNTISGVPFGTYYAQEIEPPFSGVYELDKNVYEVTISDGATTANGLFEATNKFKKGKAYVNKVPAEQPDGSCKLSGAEYAVCKDEDCREVVVTLITDEKGKTKTVELEPGVYYFQEQKAPACFEVNPEVQRITIVSGKTVKVTSKEELIPQNPKTGIDNPYLITITTVAIGGMGLYFLRRKNAFRQI